MPEKTAAGAGKGAGKARGHGGRVAARRFEEPERSFAEKDAVKKKGHRAVQAFEPPRGGEPVRARKDAGGKRPQADSAASADPHTDENLDEGLEETFPASDPVSISPGAD